MILMKVWVIVCFAIDYTLSPLTGGFFNCVRYSNFMTSTQFQNAAAVAGVHTVIGTGLFIASATVCPPLIAVWWCHGFMALAHLTERR